METGEKAFPALARLVKICATVSGGKPATGGAGVCASAALALSELERELLFGSAGKFILISGLVSGHFLAYQTANDRERRRR
jgi:hypothetical protein